MPPVHKDPIPRFFAKVIEAPDGCWLWTGAKGSHGYGNFGYRKPKTTTAHRYAYELWHGPIPDGLVVCHTCDVRLCVNPDHLFLGTYKENTQDGVAKGRIFGARYNPARGERSGKAVLTEEQVRAIRADPRRQVDIAADYGIAQAHVSRILRREVWAHI